MSASSITVKVGGRTIRVRTAKAGIVKGTEGTEGEDTAGVEGPEGISNAVPRRKVPRLIVQQDLSDIDQDWTIERIVKEKPPLGWKEMFEGLAKSARTIDGILAPRGEYLPLKKDIFNAYHWTPLDLVKVVIVGQDPYHTVIKGVPQAVGAAFSLRRDAPLQPSIRNIYTEIKNEYAETDTPFTPPTHGDLSGWARQGVLLLNVCLTVEEACPRAHYPKSKNPQGNIWFGFISQTFKYIRENRPNTVIMLWGKEAQDMIGPQFRGRLHTLESAHPSPFSVRGFYGNNHFMLANEHLISNGIAPIKWDKFD